MEKLKTYRAKFNTIIMNRKITRNQFFEFFYTFADTNKIHLSYRHHIHLGTTLSP